MAVLGPPKSSRKEKDLLFKFLLLANFLEYLEAGAVPALLLQLSTAFHMSPGQQGLLGGVVYLSLSLGGPFAGYLLRHHDHRTVVGAAVAINNFFTLLWALTPVNLPYSTLMFIAVRFLMGLTQCVICVFLPLWTNQFAPRDKRTSWMGYLQVSDEKYRIFHGFVMTLQITISSKT
jgi:MFS family permease